jgi:hypothetical protein
MIFSIPTRLRSLLNVFKRIKASFTIGFSRFSFIYFIQKCLEICFYLGETFESKSLLFFRKNKNKTQDLLSTSALIAISEIQKIMRFPAGFHCALIYLNLLYNLPVFQTRNLARPKMLTDSSYLQLFPSLPKNSSLIFLSRKCAESILSVSLYLTDFNFITLNLNEYFAKKYLPFKNLILPINIPKNMQINTKYYFRK